MSTPTSATGTLTAEPGPRPQQGFTLLEILAVIVIIAIVVSLAGLRLSARAVDERLATEAERLQVLLRLAADEAVVQGEEIGLLVAADGYAFYHLEQNRWVAYEVGPLRERELPEGMSLNLSQVEDAEEVRLPMPDDAGNSGDKKQKQAAPQILLLSSGELTPFVLQLRLGGHPVYFQSEGKITGTIETRRVEARPA